MRIFINGKPSDVEEMTVSGLRSGLGPGQCVVLNGFSAADDVMLKDGDTVMIFDRDHCPSISEYDALLSARDPPGMHDKIRTAKVGIAGLGGLGSAVASMLVRSGIEDVVMADMDDVDITNLNRQIYY